MPGEFDVMYIFHKFRTQFAEESETMLPFLSITGISVLIILLYFNVRKYPSSLYLGLYFLLVSLYVFHVYAFFYSHSIKLVSITYIHFGFLAYLIGPLLYLYIRSVLRDDSRLRRNDLWHFIPMLISLITTIPYILLPYEEKLEIAGQIVDTPNDLGSLHPTLLFDTLSPMVVFLSRPFLILGYTIWSSFLFVRYILQPQKSLALKQHYFMTGWLTVLLGFTLLLNIAHLLSITKTYADENSDLFFSLHLLQILSAVGISGLVISPFFFPRILYGLPLLPGPADSQRPNAASANGTNGESKKSTLNLEAEYLQTIGQKADACMKEFEPYLQPDFNLIQLSVLIDVPAHHLAYHFREVRKKSFMEYRNEWRINHSKNLLLKGMAHEMTLEAIGKMSGFSNRNSFRITFEKIEGVSPSAFAPKEE